MKKKGPSHIFPVFGSIRSLFILVFCTACASFDSYLETALNFSDVHQTELQAAQVALQEFTDSNECFMWITSTDSLGENYNYNNGYTKKYGGLYFISPEGYPDETYQNLYAFVSPLFSDDLHSIEASKDMIRFTVLLTSNIGTDSSLVWTNGEKAPTGTYPTVQRQRQLDAHWYAITASD